MIRTTCAVIFASLIITGARANTVSIDTIAGNDNYVYATMSFSWSGGDTFSGSTAATVEGDDVQFGFSTAPGLTAFSFLPGWTLAPVTSATLVTGPGFSFTGNGGDFALGYVPTHPEDLIQWGFTGAPIGPFTLYTEVFDPVVGGNLFFSQAFTLNLNIDQDGMGGSGTLSVLETRLAVPDGGATAGLLTASLAVLAFVKRRV